MKILHVYDEHQPVDIGNGSVSTVIYRLATKTAENGHDVTVAERKWKKMPSQEEKEGIRFKRFNLKIGSNVPGEEIPYDEVQSAKGTVKLILDRLQFAYKLNRFIEQEHFDIIHVHLPFTANILIHLNRDIRKKLVYTAHIGEEEMRLGLEDSEEQPVVLQYISPDVHLIKRSAVSTVLNKPIQSLLENENISVNFIPNGVDIESFPVGDNLISTVRKKYDVDHPLILFSGSITPRKGIESLVDAAIHLLRDGSDASFFVVGDDTIDLDFADRMKKKANNSNYDDRITFPGYIPYADLKGLYKLADVFVLPSHEEGMPISIMEALASETAIVASDVGGVPMQVDDGVNGYLISPEAPKELASALGSILDNERAGEMGEQSRQIAEERFSWKQITQQYIERYNSIRK
ncbi:glycosyltransferase [Halobellus sp. GM3]|uniref:glycosyltransferase n=1 Tax=Halobellus sp. GM3 TaxID=3458410 RepID=UPI00403DB173